jgi:hypothetical protein
MRISNQQLADYIGVHVSNVKKHKQTYLDILETSRKYLTIFDIIKIDDVPVDVVCCMMNIYDKKVIKACELMRKRPM